MRVTPKQFDVFNRITGSHVQVPTGGLELYVDSSCMLDIIKCLDVDKSWAEGNLIITREA